MSNARRYQLVALGPAADRFWDELEAEFNARVRDIGLDPGVDAEALRSTRINRIDIQWGSAPVAIWFGDESPPTQWDLDILEDFQVKRPNPLLPVCESKEGFEEKVPTSLRHINGQDWEAVSVVANVLKAFNLSRKDRQVFISYRRIDSAAVAQQLYDALQHRKFRVFLDTASVDAGLVFQDVLHGRLSDVDLVVFLDTKNALDSEWVYEELLQAEKQGFGILQVLWPGRRRDRATEFCDLSELKKVNLEDWSPADDDDQPDPKDRLNEATIAAIAREVERTRIRSIRNRRDQVLTEVVDTAQEASLEANINPTGDEKIPFPFIRFCKGDDQAGLAFPVVGFPDSILLHGRHDLVVLNKHDLKGSCIVYDELGMTARQKAHLD